VTNYTEDTKWTYTNEGDGSLEICYYGNYCICYEQYYKYNFGSYRHPLFTSTILHDNNMIQKSVLWTKENTCLYAFIIVTINITLESRLVYVEWTDCFTLKLK